MSDSDRAEIVTILVKWMTRCRVSMFAYNMATDIATGRERYLGIPATVLSAVVATSVFATLSRDPSIGWRIATGTAALLSSRK
jgi:hypothetical protein